MKKLLITLLVGIIMDGIVCADVITVNVADSGYYNNGSHNATDRNYFVGGSGYEYNNFFVFDLSGIENATSATFQLYTFGVYSPGTYTLYDVGTPISSLTAGGTGLTDTYNDLGSGLSYGSVAVNGGNSLIQITLNSNAISSINSAGGLWAIGGSYDSSGTGAFHTSGSHSGNKLIVETIPEPSTLAFLGIFGGGLWVVRRYFPRV